MQPMTYFEWLMRHRLRDSPLGRFAGDAAADAQFPHDVATSKDLVAYLKARGAAGTVLRVAKTSWKSWRRRAREDEAANTDAALIAAIRELLEFKRLAAGAGRKR